MAIYLTRCPLKCGKLSTLCNIFGVKQKSLNQTSFERSVYMALCRTEYNRTNICKIGLNPRYIFPHVQSVRSKKYWKSNKKTENLESEIKEVLQEDDDDDEDDDEFEKIEKERGVQVKILQVNSPRMDLLLKNGLNISRNVVDQSFYKGMIRVNGKKVHKKSYLVDVSDEIDLIKGVSEDNPDFLEVSRIEVVAVRPAENLLMRTKIRKYKSLTIENYSEHPWYPSDETQGEEEEEAS